MKLNDRVNRIEDRPTRGATILEVKGENALIAYDEGGQGWWPLSELEPSEPSADWFTFKNTAFSDPTLNQIVASVSAITPLAALSLPAAFIKAEAGDPTDFAVCWSAITSSVEVDPNLLQAFITLAEQCRLPQDFINCLTP